ncbi:GNAT family N-acetyltransferase [Embleya sp. NBC_00896]|uniref:GNAT family N-acetyltransferase n=1 Tax=Embleya sp. NBC_00896 TaxID=2975961 RepID=UPI0038652B9D|nr:GNAT family N-acetyltransferase [Embleya sp. NBC_00896]
MSGPEVGNSPFTVRELGKHDEPRVLSLLEDALSGGPTGERTPEFFRWKHRDNPFGASPGLVAEADGRVVAVRLFLRWEFVLGGEVIRAVRAVDTATHPDVQGRGLFRRLTTELLDRIEADTSLVFNTPNGNSLPGYLKMGWHEVGKVPISLHPIRPIAFARGLKELRATGDLTGTSQTWNSIDPAARCRFPTARQFFSDPAAAVGFDELVAEADAGDAAIGHDKLRTALSGDFLRWRYGDAPGLDYRVVASYKNGELTGVVFGRPRLRGPLVEFTLSQMVVRPGDRDTARKLFSGVAMSGCDHVATHLARGSEAARAARYAGYATPPRTGMLLVARTVHPHPIDVHDLRSWQLSLGDLEVF